MGKSSGWVAIILGQKGAKQEGFGDSEHSLGAWSSLVGGNTEKRILLGERGEMGGGGGGLGVQGWEER